MKIINFNYKLIVILALLTSTFLFSQNIKISGVVVTTGNQPVPYSSISLSNTENQTKVFGGLSDEKGKFNIEITPGEYDIEIDQAGFESYVDQRNLNENTFLGNLIIEQAGKEKEIEGIVVQATKPIYRVELDKKVYDVSQDLTAKGGTLSDVMQNVPSVSVDVDGTVSLRGNDNVKILIDGKPSAMLGITDVGDALKTLSADMVDRIEVVTNASARYEAAGTAGIINIITKKDKKPGITGSVQVLGGSPQLYGTNISLGYGKKTWSWFANAGVRYSKATGENSTNYSRFDSIGNTAQHYLQNSDRRSERTSFNFNTGFNFNFDDYNSLTTSVGYKINNANNRNINGYTYLFPTGIPYSERKEYQHNDGYGIDGNLNFTHNFLKKGNVLTVDGNFNYTVDDSDSNIFDEILGKSLNNNTRSGFMAKSDYILPLKEDSQFEAGVRADYSKTKTEFSLNELRNAEWALNPDYTDNTNYQENIFAAYIQYGNKFGDFSFLAGLREETSFIKVQSEKENANITKNYTDLFPTLHLNYDVTEKSQVQLSYSRRINRPRSRMLIPYKSLSDDKNTFSGNPNLDPSITDSYELGYNIQYRTWGLTPSIYFQRTNDPFQMVTTPNEQGNLNTSPINLGYENRYGGDISYSLNPYKWWRIFGEVNLYQYENYGSHTYTTVNSGTLTPTVITENLEKKGFSWNTKLNMTLKLPESFNLQLQGNYMAPRKSGQNDYKEMYGMNLGISKDVLKGQGTLLFNIQDVLNSRKRKIETFGENFYKYSEMQWRPRQFTLTFTYRFSKETKKNEKKNRNQNGNDSDMDEMPM